MNGEHTHLSPERIQAFLEGELPSREAARVQGHVLGCPGCRDQLESWRGLLAQLDDLPRMEPSATFSRSVLDRLELAPELQIAPAHDHPAWEVLQEWADGMLPRAARVRVDRHLEECPSCAAEGARWRELFAAIQTVPELHPAPGFGQGVLARVPHLMSGETRESVVKPRVAAWAGVVRGLLAGLSGRLGALRPRTRRGWLLAGSAVAAPGLAFAAVVALVAAHPLLTLGDLTAFAWLRATGLVAGLAGQVGSGLVESVALFRAYSLASGVLSAPLQFGALALGMAVATLWAAWTLYRNLNFYSLLTPAGTHARAT